MSLYFWEKKGDRLLLFSKVFYWETDLWVRIQSWTLKLGHLTLPTPLNQCCNQTRCSLLVAFTATQHWTVGRGGEGRMEIEYLKNKQKNPELCTSVPNIFSKIVGDFTVKCEGDLYLTENRLSETKCGVLQVITMICFTCVQKDFKIRTLIK